MANLLDNTTIYHSLAAISAASNTDSDGAAVDTQNGDGVLFITTITDSVATGVATLKAIQCATSGGTYADTVASVSATSAINDDLNSKLLILDVYKPGERYVKPNLVSATANIAFGETIAIVYKGRSKPVAQLAAEVAASGTFASPAEA